MKVQLMPGIKSISGTMKKNRDGSRVEFRTFHRPDGRTETRMYVCNKHERTTPVSKKEWEQRARFCAMSAEVHRRIKAGDKRSRKEIWEDVKAEYQKSHASV